MAYSVAHLGVFISRKKQIFGPKSNIKTPKEISEDPLTMLRPSSDYSLEFRYCFWDGFSAFPEKSHPFSDRASESGGPSLPFRQNGSKFILVKAVIPRASRGSFSEEKLESELFGNTLSKKSTLNAVGNLRFVDSGKVVI